MDYPTCMSPKHFSVLVLINTKRRIHFNQPSTICNELWTAYYIIVTLDYRSKSKFMAVIGDRGKQLIKNYTARELIEVSLEYHDVVGAAHYVHHITDMGQLPEFLTHADGIIRQAARYRVRDLKAGKGVSEPIMSATLPSGW